MMIANDVDQWPKDVMPLLRHESSLPDAGNVFTVSASSSSMLQFRPHGALQRSRIQPCQCCHRHLNPLIYEIVLFL